ncbi:WSSV522 [White spot syndrome virus]|uniref:WSSV522 n=1 Tax=White spot syndrome virus TaxID=342409 RepID=A0A2I6SCI2_9VIRU|nr:WSSV522 [White spot syndrome virus]
MEIADEEEQSPKTIKRNDNASRNWSGVCLIFEVFKTRTTLLIEEIEEVLLKRL